MSRDISIRQAIHELLQQQQLGVLSTVGGDTPYASLVAFVVSDDDRSLYFVTPRTTRKFANLTANARVAMLVNNSINHPEDFHQAAAVTAIGKAQPVGAMKLDAVRRRYLAKHPYLEAFAHSPSCEFVGIKVERYIMVERFQNVTEYRIDHDMDHTIRNPAGEGQ
jgi:nitroimidazol reductase NimA-like FMN-containing flavoprotein (pyridoxamine 5'-phosphate oxidase superfamily)